MKDRLLLPYILLIILNFGCLNKEKREKVTLDQIPGVYSVDIHSRDSIFIFDDKSYEHRYYYNDSTYDVQLNSWRFEKENSTIIFNDFSFFNDSKEVAFRGVWSPTIYVNIEGKIKIESSERVFYVKSED